MDWFGKGRVKKEEPTQGDESHTGTGPCLIPPFSFVTEKLTDWRLVFGAYCLLLQQKPRLPSTTIVVSTVRDPSPQLGSQRNLAGQKAKRELNSTGAPRPRLGPAWQSPSSPRSPSPARTCSWGRGLSVKPRVNTDRNLIERPHLGWARSLV